ncbi:MAG: nuclease-related domain-containing protein [Bacteroidia bacterium]|nr:nuclease-related domain-containing protein [Bacteroidia bacterium]
MDWGGILTNSWTLVIIQHKSVMMWIIIGIVLIVAFNFLFRKIRDKNLLETVTKSNRGTRTERDLVLKLLKHGIPKQTIFHDLYVKKYNGNFSQIDLAVVTEVGIIVFEVKDFSGWIFGNGNQPQWTKVLAYGKRKYHFYNPIMQNTKHIIDFKSQLNQLKNIPFYSIVVFYGDCVLKDVNFVPDGTFLVTSERVLEVMKIITRKNKQANYTDKNEVVRLLKKAVQAGENVETRIQHIENIKDMLGKDRIFD